MPALNYRELKRRYELDGAESTCHHLTESLGRGDLQPTDFKIRDLAEALVPDGVEWVRKMDPSRRRMTITESDAVDTSAFVNITGQVVYSAVMSGYENEAFVLSGLVRTITTQLDGEKIAGISDVASGETTQVNEGDQFPYAGVGEDYIETPNTVKRGAIVPITREAVFFDRTGILLDRAAQVGRALGIAKESRVADCIIDHDDISAHRYKWLGTTYRTYVSTPWDNTAASNALADWSDVDTAEQLFANMTDPNTGDPVMIGGVTLLTAPELRMKAAHLTAASSTAVGNGASATVQTVSNNPLAGYMPISSRMIHSRLSNDGQATSQWYLGDFNQAFAYMQNWGIETVTAGADASEAFNRDIIMQFKASERGAAATQQIAATERGNRMLKKMEDEKRLEAAKR